MDQQPRRGETFRGSFERLPKLNGICIGIYSQTGPPFTTGAGAGSQAVEQIVELLRPLPEYLLAGTAIDARQASGVTSPISWLPA